MTAPRTVLVTGAGSGFGKGASLALAERGHTVIATTESDEQAAALAVEAAALIVERIDITTDDVDKVSAWDDTGFNDSMADSMWEWFGEGSLQASNMEMFTMMRSAAVTDQMDPAAVVAKLVELTEADTTAEHNIVPKDGVEELNEATGLDH